MKNYLELRLVLKKENKIIKITKRIDKLIVKKDKIKTKKVRSLKTFIKNLKTSLKGVKSSIISHFKNAGKSIKKHCSNAKKSLKFTINNLFFSKTKLKIKTLEHKVASIIEQTGVTIYDLKVDKKMAGLTLFTPEDKTVSKEVEL